jgi:hypothetical protein
MKFDLDHTIALLSRTPATLDALLRNLPEAWTGANEGEGTWTPALVVAHLVHGERTDWIRRVEQILRAGESQPFEPVDRNAHLKLVEQESLPGLLDGFSGLRIENLDTLRSFDLAPSDLERRGRHPGFGSVTLAQLLATWATHDLTHLHQISRILAHQNRAAVGPWTRYLGVLHCDGHSAPA